MAKRVRVNLHKEIEEICSDNNFALQIPKPVVAKANSLKRPDYAESIRQGRRDLRDLALVTIDGQTAKDFDDAVFCRQVGDTFELTVVIADVTSFVAAGDLLDVEAAKRTTSVYFPGTVLPMLPPRLSEQWCSLQEKKDRFGLACAMQISASGEVVKYEFFECVINSKKRLTYEAADKIIRSGTTTDEVSTNLHALAKLTKILEARRQERGGLQIELATQVMQVSGEQVAGFKMQSRLFAHRLIEECMLIANITAAKFLKKNKYPFLYRVHAQPEKTKVSRLRQIVREFGIKVGDLNQPRNMQQVIDRIATLPALVARALNMNILRTLQRAQYTPCNIAHYGLGYDAYAHFTSPIRRYPDLLVHRAIKAVLNNERPPRGLQEDLESIGTHCSEQEMLAERAGLTLTARVFNKLQARRLGETMVGAIVGFSGGGFFVICADGLEGMVRFSHLDDYYELDEHQTKAVGKHTKHRLVVGQEVTVIFNSLDQQDGRCTFVLAP